MVPYLGFGICCTMQALWKISEDEAYENPIWELQPLSRLMCSILCNAVRLDSIFGIKHGLFKTKSKMTHIEVLG